MPIYLFCIFYLALPAGANSLITQAYETGVLDLETALLYQVQAIREPQSIPPEYREQSLLPRCGTPAIIQARQSGDQLSPDYRQRLGKILARPLLQESRITHSGHFRVHYDTDGRQAVDPTDADGNGLPDYIDTVSAVLDSVWHLQIELLGYQPPPSDGNLGGGNEYDVYIIELGSGWAYGFTNPDRTTPTTSSYIEIDDDYTDPLYVQTRGLDALRVTVAHEFFHAVQFGYYQGRDGSWWQEATATWMEEVAYPHVDDYLQYVRYFLLYPERALDASSVLSSDQHMYGAALYPHFLDQRYDRALIRAIWEELGRRASANMEHFDRALRLQIRGGLAETVGEFAVWNYFTGSRHRDGFYREGDKYPAALLREIPVDPSAPKIPMERTDRVDHLASTYLHLQPQPLSGGVVLDFQPLRGTWQSRLILVSRDSIAVRPAADFPLQLADWDRYQDVVLVLTEVDQVGSGYDYSASVTFDPDLLDAPVPVALRLEQNYPNPFRPATQRRTIFPFSLDAYSATTQLSIFAADGRLVRVFAMGELAPRSHAQAWDGRNQTGEPVGSGIYYAVLQAANKRIVRTLAVVRE